MPDECQSMPITAPESPGFYLNDEQFGQLVGRLRGQGADISGELVVTTLPGKGTLKLSGVNVTAGQEIAAGSLGSFWRYWNPVYTYYLDLFCYRPRRRWLPRPLAGETMRTFNVPPRITPTAAASPVAL